MGWLSDISGIAQSAGNIVGGYLAAESAEKARDDIRDASQEAASRSGAAATRGIEAIKAGTQEQIDLLKPQVTTAVPGMLDPAERRTREDLLRQGRRDLSAAGLRGAGRSGVAILRDADRRLLESFDEADEARLNAVRETMGSIRAGEGRDVANIGIGEAARSGEALQRGATAAAPFGVSAGATRGQGVIDATSSLLSQLGGIAAEEEKRASNRAFATGTV